ncbi:hypothetical protein Ocin01_09480 [Orchesella cincta]|uniref:Uncharacterized protein n=1 Tax=Orchesella cincta TaxID=48709 RepID=A0A1D2MW29_ORCCI|nr:hypothetical protein Ocin01_09480 [Orchesella cincta]
MRILLLILLASLKPEVESRSPHKRDLTGESGEDIRLSNDYGGDLPPELIEYNLAAFASGLRFDEATDGV